MTAHCAPRFSMRARPCPETEGTGCVQIKSPVQGSKALLRMGSVITDRSGRGAVRARNIQSAQASIHLLSETHTDSLRDNLPPLRSRFLRPSVTQPVAPRSTQSRPTQTLQEWLSATCGPPSKAIWQVQCRVPCALRQCASSARVPEPGPRCPRDEVGGPHLQRSERRGLLAWLASQPRTSGTSLALSCRRG